MPTQNVATVALQLEKVRKQIPLYFQKDHGLYSLLKQRTDIEVVSSRALRIPVKTSMGGGAVQVNMDGAEDLGIGLSSTWDVANVSPIYLCKPFSLSKAAEFSTNSDTKSVENATKRLVTDATDAMLSTLEALLNTDGSGTLGTVASVAGNVVTLVGSSNSFSPGQLVQVFSALGGTNRGNGTVSGLNANARTITFVTVPVGTATGDLIILGGAPGTAASSLLGIEYANSAATTGTYLGLSRSQYSQLRSNHISAGNAALTVNQPRYLLNSIRKSLGTDAANDIVWHCSTDVLSSWESLSTTVQRIDLQTSKRDSTFDMLAASEPTTIAGRKVLESIVAQPGRLDALNLKSWGRAEVAPIDLLEFGGQSLFPAYATSGGLNSLTLGYIVTGVQTFMDCPMAEGFIDNILIVPGS